MRQGELESAGRRIEKAKGLNPDNPGFRFQIGFNLKLSGKVTAAAECWNRALAADPD